MPNLVNKEGRVVVADEGDVEELLASGLYRPATADDIALDDRRAELTDLGSQAAAFGEGIASGATLGASRVAVEKGLLGDEFAEDSRDRARLNPGAAGLGEATGAIGLTLATGGAGGAATVATQGTARLLGQGALRGAIAKGAGLATSGAIEGAVFGAGHELSEAALDQELDNPAALAERMVAGAGVGALLGGVVGGAAGVGASLAGSGLGAAKRAAEALRRAPLVVDDVAASATGQVLAATADDLDTLAALTPARPASTFSEQSTAAARLDDVRQDAIRSLSAAQDEIAVAADANRAAFAVSEKPAAIRELIESGGGPASSPRPAAMEKMAALEDGIQSLSARADDFESSGRAAIRELERSLKPLAAELDDVFSRGADDVIGETVDAYRVLDRVKNLMGKAQVRSASGANGSQAAMAEIQAIREDLRGFLEAGEVWGDGVATFQRELNQDWAPLIDLSSSFEREFGTGTRRTLTGVKSEVDKTRFVSESDPKRLGGLVKGLGTAEAEKLESLYRLKLVREVRYQRKAAELFGADARAAANVRTIEDAARKAIGSLDGARQTTLDAAEFAASQEAVSSIPLVGETIAKSRATAGRVLDATSPSSPVREAAATAIEGGSAIARAARGVVDGLGKRAKGAGRVAVRGSTLFGVKVAGNKDVEAYTKVGERVQELGDRDSAARRRQRDRLSALRAERPDVADAMEAQTDRVAAFLRSKYKQASGPISDVFGQTRRARMDPASVSSFLRYAEAAQDPGSALRRAAAGEIRREDIEVLREVYPAVYTEMVADVMERVANVKTRPGYQERIRLGILLGVATDPSLTPDALQMTEASAGRLGRQDDPGAGGGPSVTPGNARPATAGGELLDPRAAGKIHSRT